MNDEWLYASLVLNLMNKLVRILQFFLKLIIIIKGLRVYD